MSVARNKTIICNLDRSRIMVVLLHRTVVVHMHFVLVRRYVNDVIYPRMCQRA
jgi:hypothetical protein